MPTGTTNTGTYVIPVSFVFRTTLIQKTNSKLSIIVMSAIYGHSLRKNFYLYDELVNLNHGSFGTVPRAVLDHQIEFLKKQESCPELWFRGVYEVFLNESRQCVSKLINGKINDIVMTENASSGINAVLRSYQFQV
jgi:selenocysteine lyase/cysteine desulfurase